MRLPKDVFMSSLDDLEDYVHNEAIPGDTLWCVADDHRKYVYSCNKDNIDKDVKPYWMVADF